MAIREANFDLSFETSDIPSTGTPSNDNDLISLGYADDTYTPKAAVYGSVATISALKAIASADRTDNQICWVYGLELFYQFDAGSSATADDDLVVQPTSGTGRWLKVEFAGSASSGTASSVEQLQQKLDNEKSKIFTTDLDNSKGLSGVIQPKQKLFSGTLAADAASGSSSLFVVWNADYPASGDANLEVTTDWTAENAAASLSTTSTAGHFSVGSAALSFDKNGSATTADIYHDRGSQNQSFATNYRVWLKAYIPSITNLTNVFIRVYSGSTSNYAQFNATTQYDSSAIAAATLNTFVFDVSGTPSATGGTSFNYQTELSRYFGFGVTTSSAGQTYTGIALDSVYFSYGDPASIGVIANEFTVHDNSGNYSYIFSSSNTRSDGPLTISGTTSAALTGGATGSSRARIKRSGMLIDNDMIYFDTDSSLSGTITTTENVRFGRILRESLSGSYSVFSEVYTPLIFKVTSVSGNVIGFEDSSASTANIVNTNTMHVFHRNVIDADEYFVHLGDMTLTANSTASGGTTSVTGSGSVTGTIAVGDYVAKQHYSVSLSSVAATANESFSSVSSDATPNGVKLKSNNFSYPNESSVVGHYTLGDISASEAVRNRKGSLSNLTVTGTLNHGVTFKQGRTAASGFSASNYISISDALSTNLDGNGEQVQVEFWFNDAVGFTGSARWLAGKSNGVGNGWQVELSASANTVKFFTDATLRITSSAYTVGAWNQVTAIINASGICYLYLNGVLAGSYTGSPSAAGNPFGIGYSIVAAGSPATSVSIADIILWVNGSVITSSQINYLYNSGFYRNTLKFSGIEYRNTANGQSGQKVSVKGTMTRTTTSVAPLIKKIGFIKTS